MEEKRFKIGKNMFNDNELQVLFGAILGGSSLIKPRKGKNYFISMRGKELLWLQWKIYKLNILFEDKRIFEDKITYRIYSKCMPELTEIKNKFYKGNKRYIENDVLESLRDIGLAVWFLEGGGRIGRNKKNAYLNCKKYGEIGGKKIEKYFNSLNIFCRLSATGRLVFSVDGTEKFFKITAHQFPDFMRYKLADR